MKKKKIILLVMAGILLVAGIVIGPFIAKILIADDFKAHLKAPVIEEGTEYAPLEDANPSVSGMDLVAENDKLKLYTDPDTAEIALYDKRNGQIYYSNPTDRANRVGVDTDSQFSITYYDPSRQRGTMDSYSMSVERGQFTAESIENGIRYTYVLGELGSETGIVPTRISKERLEMFLGRVSEKSANDTRKRYVESKDEPGIMLLLETAITRINISRMTEVFTEAGYTQEDYDLDMASVEGEEVISFTIPLEYRLTEDGLSARIETSQIEETGGVKLYNILLLRYFGAANPETEGYMFVPNGSGSLINFNNGKGNYGYTQYVYDVDPTVAGFVVLENLTPAQLPVYGMKYEEGALFSVITEGDALARIDASTAGATSDYNNVFTTFYVRGFELLQMFGITGAQSDLPIIEEDLYETALEVEYIPLSGEDADYAGMATYYRNRLVEEGVLKETLDNTSLPFYLDILGGVNVTNNVAGIQYDKVFEMTTYKEAKSIAETLAQGGVSNIRMNYLGWFNGGYYHDVPDKIKDATELGSKKDISALNEYLASSGGGLFGNVAFNKVKYQSDRYYMSQEAAKYYSGKSLMLTNVNPYTLRRGNDIIYTETMYSMLSPRYLEYYVENFADEFSKYDMSGVAARDLGSALTSDKKRTDFLHRQTALEITERALSTLAETGKDVLIYGGNAYSLGYTKDIVGAPLNASRLPVVDANVPFYEMVIHGYINYTGAELNLTQSADRNELLLNLIESGASPRYVMSYENSDEIKYSGMNHMYSVQYELYQEEAKYFYAELSEALKDVVNVPMADHEIIEEDVRKVTYENGVTLYINRSDKDVEVDGITVPAGWYSRGGSK